MTNQNQVKQNGASGFNPVVAAVAGAVIGAGVAAVGVVALEDKKNQEKIKRAFNYMQKQAEHKKKEIEVKIADSKEKVKKIEKVIKD